MESQTASAVCCSCLHRPSKKYQPTKSQRRSAVYHDDGDGRAKLRWMFFLDAEEEKMVDDDYPIITTSYIRNDPTNVSWKDPTTFLRREDASVDHDETKQSLSAKSERSKRRSSFAVMFGSGVVPKEPSIEVVERGFPGQLNNDELEQCKTFYGELKKWPVMMEIVFSLNDVEEEAYSLCRWLRANNFRADRTLKRLEGMIPDWEVAKAHDFYPDPGKHMGVPVPVVWSMYPFVYHGNAKNGCPVSYLKAGMLDTEGLLSLTTIEKSPAYYWYQHLVNFRESIRKARKRNPNFKRCESVCVIDLTGLKSSNLTMEANETMKVSSKIGSYFPENLHALLIINAPRWFSFTWKIIRSFLDPRTARKIEVYGVNDLGEDRLRELIDVDEIPSDFGGSAPSTEQITSGGDKDNDQWSVEVVHVKPRSKSVVSDFVVLKEGEQLSIQVYTRSITGVAVSVFLDDSIVKKVDISQASSVSEFSLDNLPKPYCTEICHVSDPGRYSVQLEDLRDVKSFNKRLPHGCFVVIGHTIRSVVIEN